MNHRFRPQKIDLLWMALFLTLTLLLFEKCAYGFAFMDESFYLTIPYRLAQGDSLLLHEWHPSQLSGVLLYPFVKLYLMIFHSTDGIVLADRYLFTVLHCITAVVVYRRLSGRKISAFFCSLMYLVFVPYGVSALSYNSMGLGLMVLCCVLLYSNEAQNPWVQIFAGICFAGSVLCCPFLVILFLQYAVVTLVLHLGKIKTAGLMPKDFGLFTLGCGISGVLFLGFFLAHLPHPVSGEVKNLVFSIQALLHDPEHESRSLLALRREFAYNILHIHRISLAIGAGIAVEGLSFLLDQGRKKRAVSYYTAALFLTALYVYVFLFKNRYLNFYMFPLCVLGFFTIALFPRKYKREGIFLWIPGFAYAFFLNWASNQEFYSISNAMTLATFAGIITGLDALKYFSGQKIPRLVKIGLNTALYGLLILLLAATAWERYNFYFWEPAAKPEMTQILTVGSHKGLHVSPEIEEEYLDLLEEAQVRQRLDEEKVLYYTTNTWLYLNTRARFGTFSAWASEVNPHSAQRLMDYYALFPDRMPDSVFLFQEDAQQVPEFLDYLKNRGYTLEKTKTGLLYTGPNGKGGSA